MDAKGRASLNIFSSLYFHLVMPLFWVFYKYTLFVAEQTEGYVIALLVFHVFYEISLLTARSYHRIIYCHASHKLKLGEPQEAREPHNE